MDIKIGIEKGLNLNVWFIKENGEKVYLVKGADPRAQNISLTVPFVNAMEGLWEFKPDGEFNVIENELKQYK